MKYFIYFNEVSVTTMNAKEKICLNYPMYRIETFISQGNLIDFLGFLLKYIR